MKRENEKDKPQEPRKDEDILHTPDPQENMTGPLSSSTKKTGDLFKSEESWKEAQQKRDERL